MANVPNHGIVALNKSKAGTSGIIYSVQYSADIDNGSLGTVGALVTNEFEIYTMGVCGAPTTDTLVLLYSPEEVYIPGQTKQDFTNAKGKAIRAYSLGIGDEFTITDNMITNPSVVGQYLVPTASATVFTAQSGTPTSKLAAVVVAKTTLGSANFVFPATRFRVIAG